MLGLPQFLSRFGLRRSPQSVPAALYGAVVAQSRQPAFYTGFGIADTVTGRFDILCLHMFLLTRRFAAQHDGRAAALSQDVFDCFAADLDRALRDLGVGDTSVPKRKQRMIRGYYGQIEDFARPLDDDDQPALEHKVVERFLGKDSEQAAARLAAYMQTADRQLAGQPLEQFLEGGIEWPQLSS